MLPWQTTGFVIALHNIVRKILLVHNRYREAGGEDRAFDQEVHLLRSKGHCVSTFVTSNSSIPTPLMPLLGLVASWNQRVYSKIVDIVLSGRIDVVHFHNTFPMISPSGYYAAHRAGAAVVQTLHNYRAICPGATLFRDSQSCVRCVEMASFGPAIRHRCYRGSLFATTAVVGLNILHKSLGTWVKQVDKYICMSPLSRDQFVAAGFPSERMIVKPNFVLNDYGVGAGSETTFLFVGRVCEEKGVAFLLKAWQRVPSNLRLRIIGRGPLERTVESCAERMRNVEYLGALPSEEVAKAMQEARALIVPSLWYESAFPLVGIEAFAAGTPVLCSAHGPLGAGVIEWHNGFLFKPGDELDFVSKVKSLAQQDSGPLRSNARKTFEAVYSSDIHYSAILDVYRSALLEAQRVPL